MACKIEFRNFGTNTRDAILAKHSAILEFDAGTWPVVSEHLLYFCEQEIQEIATHDFLIWNQTSRRFG
jgi:hypothetical protein